MKLNKFLLKKPNSQLTEGCYLLLTHKTVSRADAFKYSHILNFPAIICVLRNKYNQAIGMEEKTVKNKFGREVSYGRYKSLDDDRLKALYLKLLEKG